MMTGQQTFERYELKYMLTQDQKAKILDAMTAHMRQDEYGRATIRNVYFDTDTYRLIRRSLEHPAYKEKLRVRSYRQAEAQDEIYVELKKKYHSVVYKRRILMPQQQAMKCLCTGAPFPKNSQVAREIDYFRQYYQTLRPVVFLSYEREAFFALDGSDFRVTFDENILYREEGLSLREPPCGSRLMDENRTLLEIKTSGGVPLWMTHVLSQNHIFRTTFSKYGAAYLTMLQKKKKGAKKYA